MPCLPLGSDRTLCPGARDERDLARELRGRAKQRRFAELTTLDDEFGNSETRIGSRGRFGVARALRASRGVRESSPALDTRSARGVEFANGLLRSAEGSVRHAREICRVVALLSRGKKLAIFRRASFVSESRLVKKFR